MVADASVQSNIGGRTLNIAIAFGKPAPQIPKPKKNDLSLLKIDILQFLHEDGKTVSRKKYVKPYK